MTDLAPTYAVEVGGAPLGQRDLNQVKEIRVSNYLRLPDICTLSLHFDKPEDFDAGDFAWKVGAKLVVKVGKASDPTNSMAPVFHGTVTTLEPEFGPGGVELSVRAFDQGQKLMASRNSQMYKDSTFSDIFRMVVRRAGLMAEVEATAVVYPFTQQSGETDWDFLWRLADREGMEFVVEDAKAILRKPSADGSVTLTWPEDLLEFRPRLTSIQQAAKVTARGWDVKAKQPIEATATTPEMVTKLGVDRGSMSSKNNGSVEVVTEAVTHQGEAKALAQGLLDRLGNAYATADGVAFGNQAIKAGLAVEIKGVGTAFGGTYRVGHVEHILKGSGFETHFGSSPPTVLGSIGNSNGSHSQWSAQFVLGLVTKTKDPQSLGRVAVKFPTLDGGVLESAWARVVVPNAGSGTRGLVMTPQVGDEVLVGFLGGDSRYPYVLGSLYNAVDAPDTDISTDIDKSESFFMHTNGWAHLFSHGDFKIHTMGNTKVSQYKDGMLDISVVDKVQQSSVKDWTVESTNGKAALASAQDFAIESKRAKVTVKAQNNVEVEATSQVTIKGNAKVSLQSTGGVELTCGAASVKLDPSGVTISGPLIRIG